MKKCLVFFITVLFTSGLFAQQFSEPFRCSHFNKTLEENTAAKHREAYSDTIYVSNYNINLDISNLGAKTIQGYAEISFMPLIENLSQLKFDLLALTVDSVIFQGGQLSYSYNDTLLLINLPTALNQNQIYSIKIYYGGQPVMDDSGWGGVYFNSTYGYNLGVGFAANPHNYGRVWHPCVDNFTARATYDMSITTADDKVAVCGGLLINSTNNGNGTITWQWQLNQSIPTYLASWAVSDYTFAKSTFAGLNGNVPVWLAARAGDTTNFKASFQNLDANLHGFETAFGPYEWDRVGFVLVPFNSGAMEHATNIAYPRYAANGSLGNEALMAHELSHHWFGDLVTCSTPEDMWLNEGWASYASNIFFEQVYNKATFKDKVRANLSEVLRYTHIKDDGFRAVSGVPHAYTYGSTVYDKGESVAHTLRGYMGDSLFFNCVTGFLQQFKFNSISSHDLKDYLSDCSGINLNLFFDNWVFNPGFSDFHISSYNSEPTPALTKVTVEIKQRLKGTNDYHSNIPLTLSFFGASGFRIDENIIMTGSCRTASFDLPYEPTFIALDYDEKIADANTIYHQNINTPGSYDFKEAQMDLQVLTVPDTALVLVEHHWVAPSPLKTPIPGFHLSKERFWVVDGNWPTGFTTNATVNYNGTTSSTNGYFDNELITNIEDSLVLMYRLDGTTDWQPFPDFEVNVQVQNNNKRGFIEINDLQKGQYTLGIYDAARPYNPAVEDSSDCFGVAINESLVQIEKKLVNIYPNPTNDTFRVEFGEPINEDVEIKLYTVMAEEVSSVMLKKGEQTAIFYIENAQDGVFLVMFKIGDQHYSKQIILSK